MTVDRWFGQDAQGNFYVRPYGIFGKRRRFLSEEAYLSARGYYERTYPILIGLGCGCGFFIVKYGAVGLLTIVPVSAYSLLVVTPRIRRDTEPMNRQG